MIGKTLKKNKNLNTNNYNKHNIMILLISEHAKRRMAEHAITKEMVKEAIERGSKIRQTDGLLATYTYFQVAYKVVQKEVYKIKTVMVRK